MDLRTQRMDLGLLVLRIGSAVLLFTGHGWPKLINFNERLHSFADPIGVGPSMSFILVVFAEVVCSLLVLVGWWTRLAVIPLLVFFAVAAFVHHAADPWPRREFALIFATPFLALLFTGAGRFSFDSIFDRSRKR